jgi:UDP-N-acetylglucosamine--N-acetylmuramyl-(pentapeptide) pyrophosphoryl-undecaprenol N-acetylglucosamine transferase
VKILMTGGGTGGHLYPALAVAEALKNMQKEMEILFIGSTRGIESAEVPEAGFAFQGLSTTGFPRRVGLRTITAAWSFVRAILAARKILREFRPQVVFSTGGYASAPVVVAARLEKIPVVLHEQNSIPGVTNRIASRLAAEVHLAFASARQFFPKRGHLRLSGNPLREQVLSGSRTRALRLFRLDEQRKTVLVFGGSQGAHSINEAILDALSSFQGRDDIQFLIQSGMNDYETMLARCRDLSVKTWVRRFIANMGDAYALADVVVCRAGAMTLSELAACGLPSILIPYPHAAANHQWLNAEQMRDAGAARVVSDAEMDGSVLARAIQEILANPRKLREMSVNALRMARPDATEKIARALLRFRPVAEIPPEPEPARRGGEHRSRNLAPRRVGPPRVGQARNGSGRAVASRQESESRSGGGQGRGRRGEPERARGGRDRDAGGRDGRGQAGTGARRQRGARPGGGSVPGSAGGRPAGTRDGGGGPE